MNPLLLLSLTALWVTEMMATTAFIISAPAPAKTTATTTITTTTLGAMLEMELQVEPAGGQELTTPTATLPGCRMKQMKLCDDKKVSSSSSSPAYEFWMTAVVQGALIQEIRTQVLKDASRKANFPGFRKGQIPPYAQPQITNFALQEAIMKIVQAAVDAYGITPLSGSDGEVTVHEDVGEMTKKYKKIGDDVQFTATLYATYADKKSNDEKPNEEEDASSTSATGNAVMESKNETPS